MPQPAPRPCPGCRAPLPAGAPSTCPRCGLSLSAGIVRRDQPHQTRGLEAVSRKFGARWSFVFSGLMLLVIGVYYDDISTAERTGKTFSADAFTGLVYDVGGKWAVLAMWLAFAVLFFLAGVRARRRARAGS